MTTTALMTARMGVEWAARTNIKQVFIFGGFASYSQTTRDMVSKDFLYGNIDRRTVSCCLCKPRWIYIMKNIEGQVKQWSTFIQWNKQLSKCLLVAQKVISNLRHQAVTDMTFSVYQIALLQSSFVSVIQIVLSCFCIKRAGCDIWTLCPKNIQILNVLYCWWRINVGEDI